MALPLVLSAFLTLFPTAADKPNDAEALSGTWTRVALIHNGKEQPATGTIVIAKGRYTMVLPNGKTVPGSLTLRPETSPPEFDLQFDPLPNDRVAPRIRGIYELKGDTLRMCMTVDATSPRPGEFKAAEGSPYRVDVYERHAPFPEPPRNSGR